MLKTRATGNEFPEIFAGRAGVCRASHFRRISPSTTRDAARREVVGDCLTRPCDASVSRRRELPLARVDLVEANEPGAVLVPEREAQRGHAGSERHDWRHVHKRILIVTVLQPVVRNARRQVMNVVQSDVACEPSQRRRELEVRAAPQRGGRVIPFAVLGPIRILELVLHVKQPYTCHRRQVIRKAVRDEHGFPAEHPEGDTQHRDDADIGCPDAIDLASARPCCARENVGRASGETARPAATALDDE